MSWSLDDTWDTIVVAAMIAAVVLAILFGGCAPSNGPIHELDRGDCLLIPAGSEIIAPDGEMLTIRFADGGSRRVGLFMPARFLIATTPLDYVLRNPTTQPEGKR